MSADWALLDRHDERFEEWLEFVKTRLNLTGLLHLVVEVIQGHGVISSKPKAIMGAYNINWQVEFEDGFSVMVHSPIPCKVAFPDEKIRAEVAAMKLIREKTTIPVPKIYYWCTSSESPPDFGPLIIMEYIEHTKSLEQVLVNKVDGNRGLREDLSDETLLRAYRQMANIMLQMSTIEGSSIGSPTPSSNSPAGKVPALSSLPRISRVHNRLISQYMNDLVGIFGLSPNVLPARNKTYSTSTEYYQAMADLNFAQMALQYHDAAPSQAEGCEKYVARQLFRKLAREGQLATNLEGHGDAARQKEVFKLWCDDLRPGNVLLDDDDNVVGVIDWEWTYFAPASFYHSAPWWLTFVPPAVFEEDWSDWSKDFERRLPLFLKAMDLEKASLEDSQSSNALRANGVDLEAIDEVDRPDTRAALAPISSRIRQDWDTGRFWVDLVVRQGYYLDWVYWKYIDERFFGSRKVSFLFRSRKSRYKARLNLLSKKEVAQMMPFVAWKLKAEQDDRKNTGEDRRVVEWEEHDAQTIWTACLAGTLGEIQIPEPRVIPFTTRSKRDKQQKEGH